MNVQLDKLSAGGVQPPRLSVMIPTYLPGDHLLQALEAVQLAVARAGVASQVEVVDDASPSLDVGALIAGWVREGHIQPVDVYRRPLNGGLGRCWNECIDRAKGELVHILHQDDLIKSTFYQRVVELEKEYPQAGMIFCRTSFLEGVRERSDALEQEQAGIIENWLPRICSSQRLQCPSVVVRRSVYARLGGYDPDLRYVIDWEMWIRIAAFESVAYIPESLAVYRIHSKAESARIKAAGIATLDAARGLRRIKRTLRAAGRMDCYRLAVGFGIAISGFAAHEAERAGQWNLVSVELLAGLRRFGINMKPGILARQVRGYVRARLKTIRHSGRFSV